jgi:hypothetical protein
MREDHAFLFTTLGESQYSERAIVVSFNQSEEGVCKSNTSSTTDYQIKFILKFESDTIF